MPSAENRSLCERDAEIAGLRIVLQPSAVLEAIRSHGQLDAQKARLEYLRYKPARRCIGLFNVNWGDADPELPTILVATAMTKDSWKKFLELRSASAIEQGAILLTEHRIALEWFPNDHGLKNAAKVMAVSSRSKVLRRILQCEPMDAFELNTLAYKPARRHVACGTTNGKRIFTLKTYTNRGYIDALWRTQLAVESGLSNCTLLGDSSRYASIATSWIDGQTLSQWMLSPRFSEATLAKVGVELAKWHAKGQQFVSHPSLVSNQKTDDVSLLELADDIAILAPFLSLRASTLAKELTVRLSNLRKAHDVIHGDFYAKQVILDPTSDRVQFIDFDQLQLGDRYEDIANFIAKNYWQVIHEGLSEKNCESANEQFLDGYSSHYGYLDRDRLRLHVSSAMFRCLPHAFRRALPNWSKQIEWFLSLAEGWLGGHSAFKSDSHKLVSHSLDCFLDLSRVHAAWNDCSSDIAEPLKTSTVTAATLVRHKPLRRLLVEYTLTHPTEVGRATRILGKARLSKGMDVRTPQLHQQLLDYDWGDSQLRVPQVLGLVPSLSMWLQERVEGKGIYPNASMQSLAATREDHARVGSALADFHRADLRIDREFGVDNEIKKLHELFAELGRTRPELHEHLITIESDCRRLAASLPTGDIVPIHRDFYFDQVLVSREYVYLLDLDLAAMGPPELDIGNYLAHLDEYGVRHPGEAETCEEAAEAFLAGYKERSLSFCIRAVEIWRYLALARHVSISARMEGRSHTTLPLIARLIARPLGEELRRLIEH